MDQMNEETKSDRFDSRKVAYAVILVAIGVILAPYTSFPIGIAKVNPTQHFVNVIGAVVLGPWWAVIIAAVIGVIRNAMGVGTLLAFPGGMIGAFLAGYFYRFKRNVSVAASGEIIGTGFIAPVVSALFVAPVLMKKAIPLLALLPSFLASTIAGAILGVLALKLLQRADVLDLER
jgi:energy-coupling factor transport system ATP-binding protein